MRKKHLTAEQKAEELLMALGKELGESRAAFGEALLDEDQPDPPMFMTKEEWYADRPAPEKHRSVPATGKLRKVLVLAAVLVFVTSNGTAHKCNGGAEIHRTAIGALFLF